MELNIDVTMLKAVRFAASSEETRYYLQGVFLKTQGDHVVMVATDGHRMICARHLRTDGDDVLPAGIIIPLRLIDRIKIAKKLKDHTGTLTVDGQMITLRYANDFFTDQIVDGSFPDYTRVVPKGWSNEPATYNPVYLVDFVKAMKIISGDVNPVLVVHQNGLNPAVVNLSSGNEWDWFGVIMPMRGEKAMPDVSWALPKALDEAAA